MKTYAFRLTICVLLFGFAGLYTVAALAQEELFTYRHAWSSMPADTGPATVAEYEVTINVSALTRSGHEDVEFQLPDGSRFVAVPKEIEYRGKDSFAWRGNLKGDNGEGYGVITVHQGYVAGRLLFPGRDVIELKPGLESGVVRILELDSSLFPEGEDDVLMPDETGPQKSSFPISPSLVTPTRTRGSGPIIDVMVVYTPMARQQAGGTAQIEAQIQAAIDVTNDAYANSDVLQRITLVHVQEVAYDGDQNGETGSQQLTWVRRESPTVTALREQHQADLVALISEQIPDLGGMAIGMNYSHPIFERFAFSVTQRSNAVGNLLFAHELGHNMGLNHNPEASRPPPVPEKASFPWSFGYFFDLPNGERARTIMSYGTGCTAPCPKIPHFSNPNVLYDGSSTGIAHERDNARTLNLTADAVTKFRDEDWLFGSRFAFLSQPVNSSDCTRSGWSSNSGSANAGFQGDTNRRYGGRCGLRVPVSNVAYGASDHPDNEHAYNVRFYAFLDDATGDIMLFDALDSSNNEVFSVWFHDGDVTLRVATASGEKIATFSSIESGWHSIHVNWESDATANVEFLVANRNTTGGSTQVISGNTSTMAISRARLGSVDGANGGGSLDFGDFVSTRVYPPDRLLVGDADNNGTINVFDIQSVGAEVVYGNFARGQPDCDENGVINVFDIQCVDNIVVSGN